MARSWPILFLMSEERLASRLRCGKVLSLSTYAGMGMTPAELAARYREYAAQCVAVAQSLDHAREKLALLDMAQAWIALARQAEKNEKLAVVYETPEVLARD